MTTWCGDVDARIQVALLCNSWNGECGAISFSESSTLVDDKGKCIFAIACKYRFGKVCSALVSSSVCEHAEAHEGIPDRH